MISPTGQGIRNDSAGSGHWGATRKRTIDGVVKKYKHKGVDFKSTFDQDIVAPFDMFIKRVSTPNVSYLSGIAFETESSSGRMWYFAPFRKVLKTNVKQGDVIGTAQSLKEYYGPKTTDHIHFQFNEIDPMILIKFAQILKGMKVIRKHE